MGLPCELGSGSGDVSSGKFTVGGGVIGRNAFYHSYFNIDHFKLFMLVPFIGKLDYIQFVVFFMYVAVIGSLEHALSALDIFGAVTSDGQPYYSDNESDEGGAGGGSGGSLLFFLQTLNLGNDSLLSTAGGHVSSGGGGGGGGGRIHFHWSNIAVGDDFIPIASIKGSIALRCVGKILSCNKSALDIFLFSSAHKIEIGCTKRKPGKVETKRAFHFVPKSL
jgi:hypothetical protein